MSDYKLRNDSVSAEPANDGARVRVLADDDREILMERSDFEALFTSSDEAEAEEAEEQAMEGPQVDDEAQG